MPEQCQSTGTPHVYQRVRPDNRLPSSTWYQYLVPRPGNVPHLERWELPPNVCLRPCRTSIVSEMKSGQDASEGDWGQKSETPVFGEERHLPEGNDDIHSLPSSQTTKGLPEIVPEICRRISDPGSENVPRTPLRMNTTQYGTIWHRIARPNRQGSRQVFPSRTLGYARAEATDVTTHRAVQYTAPRKPGHGRCEREPAQQNTVHISRPRGIRATDGAQQAHWTPSRVRRGTAQPSRREATFPMRARNGPKSRHTSTSALNVVATVP